MPDNGAVYQPTTVGYTYDSGGDATGGDGGIRNGLLRIINRPEINSMRWAEWCLLSVALSFFVTGITTVLVSLISEDESTKDVPEQKEGQSTTVPIEVEQHVSNSISSSVALGSGLALFGLALIILWVWLGFIRHGKSSRNGITSSSGQMLGGLNPSTDLLVGSTSQYGPVLTELPSQLKMKQTNDAQSVPLSDQEEETRTLMHDSTISSTVTVGSTTVTNQIPG